MHPCVRLSELPKEIIDVIQSPSFFNSRDECLQKCLSLYVARVFLSAYFYENNFDRIDKSW